MRRAALWAAAGLVQAGALAATALPPFTPGLGIPTWHHHVSLVAVLAAAALASRRMVSDRRFLGVGVLVTTVLAVASAFLLLYLKDDLKAWGLKDWAKWWHVAWSWAALAFFAGHTWVNRTGTLRSLRRMHRRAGAAALFLGAHAAILLAIPLTWSAWGMGFFTDPVYILLTHYTWLAFLTPSYAAWAWSTWRLRQGRPLRWARRPGVQAFTDAWLLSATLLVNLTGFPILYFGTKDTALKFVAKYWHTWPSIAMTILVFAHTVQFLPGVARHLRARRQVRKVGQVKAG